VVAHARLGVLDGEVAHLQAISHGDSRRVVLFAARAGFLLVKLFCSALVLFLLRSCAERGGVAKKQGTKSGQGSKNPKAKEGNQRTRSWLFED
jgi:hypothetical protein